jgi:hypothetical protein
MNQRAEASLDQKEAAERAGIGASRIRKSMREPELPGVEDQIPATERTSHPNPQPASIQTQKEFKS